MAGTAKTPAFPFYGKDAYDDEAFSRLSWRAQGLWLFLSWWQWQEGSIPEDPELIFDKMPRKKVSEGRVSWAELEPLFPSCGDGRRRSTSVERRRVKVVQGIEGKREGAKKTNEKRWGTPSHSESLTESLTESLSDTQSDRSTLQVQVQSQNGSLSQSKENGEGVAGEDKFDVALRLSDRLARVGFKYPPADQIVVAWQESGCDEALILEVLNEAETKCKGKSYTFFEAILFDWRDNPQQRPSVRMKPGSRTRRDDGRIATTAAPNTDSLQKMERADDIREAARSLKHDLQTSNGDWPHKFTRDTAERYIAHLMIHLDRADFDSAPTIEEFIAGVAS